MGYNDNRSARAPQRQGSSLLIGIMIGVILGLIIAGAVAWYLQKTPGQFLNPDRPQPEKTAVTPPVPASGVPADKPRFEFYKVLTDKQDAGITQKENGKSETPDGKPAEPAPTAAKEIYYLQAGSFSNADDADKLKARLALLGMEANVQVATIPDKGVWHRVRLGPYKGEEEMKVARATLKQNGIDANPMRAQ